MNQAIVNSEAVTRHDFKTVLARIAIVLSLALAFASTANAQRKPRELIEFWKGTIDEGGEKMEMGLKVFRKTNGSLTAKFSSYSQGATDIPVQFEKYNDTYTFEIPLAKFVYSGTLNESKDKITGKITQRGNVTELNFTKTDLDGAPKFNRPQNPKEPVPYESEEVRYKNSQQNTELAGTLTMPRGDGPFPVAITISGSGPADRNESHSDHKPFLIIADHLARRGIAVLRYDDRGVGESKGEHSGATSADLATDVEAGIDFLKTHPNIDADRIGLIGHSEGGLIAPMVAAQRTDVNFIVLLAGTGVNGGEILKSQSTAMMEADGKSAEALDANRKAHDAVFSILENNPEATPGEIEAAGKAFVDSIDDETARELAEPMVEHLVGLMNSRWVSFFVKHDPAKTLAKVKCHVLAINGEKDLQVVCDLNLKPIEKALRAGSPESFKVVRLSNVNHMFQETDGSGSPDDYGKIEQTFSPKALRVVSSWIRKVIR